jgi:hypothetical protein
MALKAGNIIVGTKKDPEDPSIQELSFHDIRTNIKMQEPVVIAELVRSDKYVIRIEGELIVNINRKSDYLRDALDLD